MANGIFSFVVLYFRCVEQPKRKERRSASAIVCAGERVPELLFRTENRSRSLTLGLLNILQGRVCQAGRPRDWDMLTSWLISRHSVRLCST